MFFRLFTSISIFSFLASPLWATTFFVMSEEEKMRAATSICAVEVESIRAERFADTIRTRATVRRVKQNNQVTECFKGNEAETFDVVWPGGRLPTLDSQGRPASEISKVIGTPELKSGQNYVLYLWKKEPSDALTVLSWMHGVMPLKFDQKTREFRIEQSTRSGKAKLTNAKSSTLNEGNSSLSEFRQKVQRTLRRP